MSPYPYKLKITNVRVCMIATEPETLLILHKSQVHITSPFPDGILQDLYSHDDVIKWKHFPRYWPFVRGIYQSPMNSLHKGEWCGTLMFSLNSAWIQGWVSNHEAVDLKRHITHYDVIVMHGTHFTKLSWAHNYMNPGYFTLAAIDPKLQHMPMFLHTSARVWGRRWSPNTSEQTGCMLKPQ